MQRVSRAMLVVGIVLSATVVLAQRPEGRGGRGFRGGGPGQGVMLLSVPEVREELKITDEQVKSLEEVRDMLQEVNFRDQLQGLRDLDREQRREKMQELQAKMEEVGQKVEARLKEILNADQLKRLGELQLQREGAMAIARPPVAEQLGLSDEQREKVRSILASTRPQRGQERPNFGELSREERQKLMEERRAQREKAESEVVAVLTDEQKAKWSEMQGEDFEFPRRRRGNQ